MPPVFRAVIRHWLKNRGSPESFRLLDVAGGLVLGVFKDDFDVEHVVVYELRML